MKPIARDNCPIMRATNEMGDQWSLLILREFFLEGPRRFRDLEDHLSLSPNTLSVRLHQLDDAGIVEREVYQTNPPRSQYSLTAKGRALAPVMEALYDWGMSHTDDLNGTG